MWIFYYAFQNQIKLVVTPEIYLKMCFLRVRMEQPVPLTGRKVTLATSLILLVDFIQSFLLGDKFSLISLEKIGKCSVCMICKFALYLLNKNNCKVIERMTFLKWSSWTLSSILAFCFDSLLSLIFVIYICFMSV